MSSHRREYRRHYSCFRRFNYRLFLGLDDANTIYPMLYAAKDLGNKTLGFQHGVYAKGNSLCNAAYRALLVV